MQFTIDENGTPTPGSTRRSDGSSLIVCAQPDSTPPPVPRHETLAPFDTFVARVREVCRRPGAQQALRAGLARPVNEVPARTHAALLRGGLVPDHAPAAEKRAYYAVAALIAARPRAERRADEDARRAADGQAGTGDRPAGTDVRPAGMEGATEGAAVEPGAGTGSPPGRPASAAPTGAPATQPKVSWGTSLGESMAQLTARRVRHNTPATGDTKQRTADTSKADGAEQRLHLLVRQDIEGLHRMLPAVLRRLGSADVSVDYGRLLRDLVRWPGRRDDIATRWLEDYYRTLRRAERPA
ncbi:type I-E CRISPR-associated protein Cse2/CasB [Streptomyces sp. SP18CS02]|uniref:type I-E CRISPR-associated protein Cse2/CasB n=1 Tax=Streptomyces sp. SP18CS02 TaxID=3002531 RepID=UPI002E78EBC9|nr:type I-E CRISPR-associated protein Cse2/CasB [Streptomyces sp. SP18CS02]MEE1756493.1 type I-E CRISPR-associated protein Cse2/CasB [Streptomyces sp. SP18CS02]